MKKHLLSLFAIAILAFSTTSVKAQLISIAADDFEVWSPDPLVPSIQDPNGGSGVAGWQCFNLLNYSLLGSSPQSVFKDSTDVMMGKYSCKIVSVALNSTGYSYVKSFIPHDTTGIVVTGKISIGANTEFKLGVPFTKRINQMVFWYQYAPQTSKLGKPDTAFASIVLTHFYGGAQNTLGAGTVPLTAATNWTLVTVPITYDSLTGNPDSATVFFSASSFTNPALGSVLHVDGESVVAGVDYIQPQNAIVKVYPNPASTEVNFSIASGDMAKYIDVYDITGQKVNTFTVSNNSAVINTLLYSTGLYIYKIYDKDGSMMKIGKFTVSK